jgi:hypothetical protein
MRPTCPSRLVSTLSYVSASALSAFAVMTLATSAHA